MHVVNAKDSSGKAEALLLNAERELHELESVDAYNRVQANADETRCNHIAQTNHFWRLYPTVGKLLNAYLSKTHRANAEI